MAEQSSIDMASCAEMSLMVMAMSLLQNNQTSKSEKHYHCVPQHLHS